MNFYSFAVWSPKEIDFPEHHVAIDPGVNVFNVVLEDVDAFRLKLSHEGIRIDRCEDLVQAGVAASDDIRPVALILKDTPVAPVLTDGNEHQSK